MALTQCGHGDVKIVERRMRVDSRNFVMHVCKQLRGIHSL